MFISDLPMYKTEMSRILSENRFYVFALILGLIGFFAITGGRIVQPTNISWLMIDGDSSGQFIGWQFFRHTPLLQWPLGRNAEYGLAISNAIVFTDSIPLLAFIFRFLDSFLPEHFQYFGLWILLCFLLQAFFAYRLLKLFISHSWQALLGAAFFVSAPIFLLRLNGHFAISGQWIILAGLYFYFAPKFRNWPWAILFSISVLVQAYFVAMIGALWIADLMQRHLIKDADPKLLLKSAVIMPSLVLGLMWAAGYFTVSGEVSTAGYGLFRMNVLAPFDPGTNPAAANAWSIVLPDLDKGYSGGEGFNYLGLGIIGLLILVSVPLLKEIKTFNYRFAPLSLIALGLTLYAISSHIWVGQTEILKLDLPKAVERIAGIFRSSGRMFWPVYYMIFLVVIGAIASFYKPRIAISLLALFLLIQIVDIHRAIVTLYERFNPPNLWASPLQSPLWAELSQRYKKIQLVLPLKSTPGYAPFAEFASTHKMAINAGYFSRLSESKLQQARQHLYETIQTEGYESDSLYIFITPDLWNVALAKHNSADIIGKLDGFSILAPKLRACFECNETYFDHIQPATFYRPEYDMRWLDFLDRQDTQPFIGMGWGSLSPSGLRTEGIPSALLFKLSSLPQTDFILEIEGRALFERRKTTQTIQVHMNGENIGTLTYERTAPDAPQRLHIPYQIMARTGGHIDIQFSNSEPGSKSLNKPYRSPDLHYRLKRLRLGPAFSEQG